LGLRLATGMLAELGLLCDTRCVHAPILENSGCTFPSADTLLNHSSKSESLDDRMIRCARALAELGADAGSVLRFSSETFQPYSLKWESRSGETPRSLRASICPFVFSVGFHLASFIRSTICFTEPGLKYSRSYTRTRSP